MLRPPQCQRSVPLPDCADVANVQLQSRMPRPPASVAASSAVGSPFSKAVVIALVVTVHVNVDTHIVDPVVVVIGVRHVEDSVVVIVCVCAVWGSVVVVVRVEEVRDQVAVQGRRPRLS